MNEGPTYDLLIVGGGLSGLVLANLLSDSGLRLGVLEKDSQARHKVCGEYLSNEIKPVLQGILPELGWEELPDIRRFVLEDQEGRTAGCSLPLGGFGLSRKTLESALRHRLAQSGVDWIVEKADSISTMEQGYVVKSRKSGELNARLVVGAYGKRSLLDQEIGRPFVSVRSKWMGVKMHYTTEKFQRDRVSLHLFPGGYAGLSAVEDGRVNLCALYHTDSFRKISKPGDFFSEVLTHNPGLAAFLEGATAQFDSPLAISNIYFGSKGIVENGIPMSGDSAGMIYPLSGNGMAMSIHSAWILSDLIRDWHCGKRDRTGLLLEYTKRWNRTFRARLRAGAVFQNAMVRPWWSQAGMRLLESYPRLLPTLVRTTHGRIIKH